MGLGNTFKRVTPFGDEIIEVEDDKGKLIITKNLVEEMTEEEIIDMPCLLLSEEDCQETKRRLIVILRHLKT